MLSTHKKSAFIEGLIQASKNLQTMMDAQAKTQGLTLSRARLLFYLAQHEGVTQSEIASVFHIEQPSVVGLVDALERKGLVERHSMVTDRRAKSLMLTEAARAQVTNILEFIETTETLLLEGIDDDELEVAFRVITRLNASIERKKAQTLAS